MVPQRARTAAAIRSMLTGFQAGVARGRTAQPVLRPMPAPPPVPPQHSQENES